MLSDRFYTLTFFTFKALESVGFVPMKFNVDTKLFVKSDRALSLLKLHILPAMAWVIFVCCQSFRFYGSIKLDEFNLNVTCSLMGLFSMEIFITSIYFCDELISFLNSVFIFLRHVNRIYMPYYDPNQEFRSKLFEAVVVSIIGSILGMGALSSIYFFLLPLSPCLIGSILPSSTFAPFRLFMLYVFPQYLTISMISSAFQLLLSPIIMGLFVVPFVLTELRMDQKVYVSRCQLRRPSNIILVYRSAQILLIKFLNILKYLLVPTQTIITNITLFSSVMLIKQGDRMSKASKAMLGSWGIVCAVGWTLLLMNGGYMHLYGNKLLDSWKCYQWQTRKDKAIMSKFRRSCKPLMIHFGRTYVIRQLSVLKFIRSISRGIFRALLTLDSEKH